MPEGDGKPFYVRASLQIDSRTSRFERHFSRRTAWVLMVAAVLTAAGVLAGLAWLIARAV